MRKRKWTGILASLGMILLIVDGKNALVGAREGVEICLYTVIPALFPFFVLSPLLTGEMVGTSSRFLRPLGQICRMPAGAESVFLVGILGGYPTGARSVHQLWNQGQLTTQQAKRMLGFCSNAGPSFLFGICAGMFPSAGYVWLLWLIHILSALFVAAVLPEEQEHGNVQIKASAMTIIESLRQAVKAIAQVCGWVVLFRVLLTFTKNTIPWGEAATFRVLFSGVLELTNGCLQLMEIPCMGTRFVLCGALLALGGICVVLQTASVTASLGLGHYIPGKLLQTIASVFLCTGVEYFLFSSQDRVPYSDILLLLSGAILFCFTFFLRKRKRQ